MWIQKIFIFVFLYTGLNQCSKDENDRFERHSHDDEDDLVHISNDLAQLSRIINAISLQSSAIQKTVQIREVVTELLKVDNASFSRIVRNDLSHFLRPFSWIEDVSRNVSKEIVGYQRKMILTSLKLNEELGAIQAKIKSINNGERFISLFNTILNPNFMKEAVGCDSEIVVITKKFSDVLESNVISNEDVIKDMISKSGELKKCMNKFQEYNKNVRDGFRDSFVPVSSLSLPRNHIENIHKLSNDFTNFTNQIKNIELLFFSIKSKMGNMGGSEVGAMLKRGVKPLETIFNPNTVTIHTWTSAFKDIKDILKIPEDLRSEWFTKMISKGKSTKKLEENLKEFFQFGKMMIDLEKNWLKFGELYQFSSKHLEETAKKINIIENPADVSVELFNDYKKSLNTCKIETSFNKSDYIDFDKSWNILNNIDFKMMEITKWIDRIVEKIDPDPVFNFLDNLGKKYSSQNTLKNIKFLRGYSTFTEFSKQFEELSRKQQEFKKSFNSSEIVEIKRKIPKYLDLISKSSVISLGSCLRNNKFDAINMNSVLNYIISVLDNSHSKPTRDLFTQFLVMRNNLTSIESFVKRAKMSYHKTNLALKFESSKEISLSFGRGVNIIRGMATAFENKKLLKDVTKYNKNIMESIQKSMKNNRRFWNDPGKPIYQLLKELDKFNEFSGALKDDNLLRMKEIFQYARKIEGFPNAFIEVYSHLKSFDYKNVNISRNVENARQLSLLELDFSAHRDYLPAASLSLGKIQNYFNEIFDLNPKIKKKTFENAYSLVVGISFAVVFVALIIVFTGYGFTKNGRNKYKMLFLYYFPIPKEFEKRWRYSLFMDRIDGKNALLDAVREINAENVLKAVKKGSYINAYTKLGNTALHVATKRGYPEIVKILIENGADRKFLNVDNVTPEELIPPNYKETHKEKLERYEKVEEIYKKYSQKTFRIQVPDLFPNSSFHIFIEGRTDDVLTNAFTDKFQAITSDEMLPTTTHCVVKTESEGHLETDDIKILLWIFSGVIIVKESWMTDCMRNGKLINRDYEYLIQSIKYNGIMYNTVTEWTNSMAKATIPYLYGVYVAVVIVGYEHIGILSTIITTNGGVLLDKFPEKESYNIGSHPYLHANLPPLFIIHDGKVDLDVYRNDPDRMYCFFTEKEFLGFMLKREINVNTTKNPIPVTIDQNFD